MHWWSETRATTSTDCAEDTGRCGRELQRTAPTSIRLHLARDEHALTLLFTAITSQIKSINSVPTLLSSLLLVSHSYPAPSWTEVSQAHPLLQALAPTTQTVRALMARSSLLAKAQVFT